MEERAHDQQEEARDGRQVSEDNRWFWTSMVLMNIIVVITLIRINDSINNSISKLITIDHTLRNVVSVVVDLAEVVKNATV